MQEIFYLECDKLLPKTEGEPHVSTRINILTRDIIGAAIEVHRHLGPGLLESAYQQCLARELTLREIPYGREWPMPL